MHWLFFGEKKGNTNVKFAAYVGVSEPEAPITIAGNPTNSTEPSVEFKVSAHEAQQLGRVIRGALKARSKGELMAKAARCGMERITVN